MITPFSEIFQNVDKDDNSKVSMKELEEWINFTHKRYISQNTEKQFVAHDHDNDGIITWNEYYKVAYGHLSGIEIYLYL